MTYKALKKTAILETALSEGQGNMVRLSELKLLRVGEKFDTVDSGEKRK
jgi:hypothetical protein